MKHLKHTFLFFFLAASNLFYAQKDTLKKQEELVWYKDMMQANELSKTTHKPIFAFFTGSDWCAWCWKLQNDVFSKREFIDWAKKNVILVELDFPKRKALSPELTEQNNSLQQTFQVQGYPTIWLFFMTKNKTSNLFDIESLGSLGYPQGADAGKEQIKFLKDANALLKKKQNK